MEIIQYSASASPVFEYKASGDPIPLALYASDVHTIIVRSHPLSQHNTVNIGRITVTNASGITTTGAVRLYVAQDTLDDTLLYAENEPSLYAGKNWAGIEDNRPSGRGKLHLKAYIKGNLTGSIVGNVVNGEPTSGYTSLNTLEVGTPNQTSDGLIRGIKVWAADGLYLVQCRVADNQGFVNTEFWADKGMGLIRATDGNLSCHILANLSGNTAGYRIDAIEAPKGVVGLDSTTFFVIGTDGTKQVSIGKISAATSIAATIRATQGIGVVEATNANGGGGHFSAVLTAKGLVGTSSQSGMIDVKGDLRGFITLLDGLPEDATIRIAGTLGTEPGNDTTVGIYCGVAESDDASLRGQIIINAANQGDLYTAPFRWARRIHVGSANRLLGPGFGAGGRFYNDTGSLLGGGAVGVVPFHRHRYDTSPSDADGPQPILQSQLNKANYQGTSDPIPQVVIDLIWYGPVKSTGTGVRVIHHIADEDPNNPGHPLEIDVTDRFTITINPSRTGGARAVRVEGIEGTFYYPGDYRIDAVTSGTNKLYCDTYNSPAVYSVDVNEDGVDDESYWFTIRWDCNDSGTDDDDDIANNGSLDTDPQDGYIDDCDRDGGCLADLNDDGYVNGIDFDIFVYFFENGHPFADFNNDEYVNGDDFDAYSYYFELGC